ncbi:hypothetical protein OAJ27_01195 [bacterium]|nr:hypothetical protein [bacterium]
MPIAASNGQATSTTSLLRSPKTKRSNQASRNWFSRAATLLFRFLALGTVASAANSTLPRTCILNSTSLPSEPFAHPLPGASCNNGLVTITHGNSSLSGDKLSLLLIQGFKLTDNYKDYYGDECMDSVNTASQHQNITRFDITTGDGKKLVLLVSNRHLGDIMKACSNPELQKTYPGPFAWIMTALAINQTLSPTPAPTPALTPAPTPAPTPDLTPAPTPDLTPPPISNKTNTSSIVSPALGSVPTNNSTAAEEEAANLILMYLLLGFAGLCGIACIACCVYKRLQNNNEDVKKSIASVDRHLDDNPLKITPDPQLKEVSESDSDSESKSESDDDQPLTPPSKNSVSFSRHININKKAIDKLIRTITAIQKKKDARWGVLAVKYNAAKENHFLLGSKIFKTLLALNDQGSNHLTLQPMCILHIFHTMITQKNYHAVSLSQTPFKKGHTAARGQTAQEPPTALEETLFAALSSTVLQSLQQKTFMEKILDSTGIEEPEVELFRNEKTKSLICHLMHTLLQQSIKQMPSDDILEDLSDDTHANNLWRAPSGALHLKEILDSLADEQPQKRQEPLVRQGFGPRQVKKTAKTNTPQDTMFKDAIESLFTPPNPTKKTPKEISLTLPPTISANAKPNFSNCLITLLSSDSTHSQSLFGTQKLSTLPTLKKIKKLFDTLNGDKVLIILQLFLYKHLDLLSGLENNFKETTLPELEDSILLRRAFCSMLQKFENEKQPFIKELSRCQEPPATFTYNKLIDHVKTYINPSEPQLEDDNLNQFKIAYKDAYHSSEQFLTSLIDGFSETLFYSQDTEQLTGLLLNSITPSNSFYQEMSCNNTFLTTLDELNEGLLSEHFLITESDKAQARPSEEVIEKLFETASSLLQKRPIQDLNQQEKIVDTLTSQIMEDWLSAYPEIPTETLFTNLLITHIVVEPVVNTLSSIEVEVEVEDPDKRKAAVKEKAFPVSALAKIAQHTVEKVLFELQAKRTAAAAAAVEEAVAEEEEGEDESKEAAASAEAKEEAPAAAAAAVIAEVNFLLAALKASAAAATKNVSINGQLKLVFEKKSESIKLLLTKLGKLTDTPRSISAFLDSKFSELKNYTRQIKEKRQEIETAAAAAATAAAATAAAAAEAATATAATAATAKKSKAKPIEHKKSGHPEPSKILEKSIAKIRELYTGFPLRRNIDEKIEEIKEKFISGLSKEQKSFEAQLNNAIYNEKIKAYIRELEKKLTLCPTNDLESNDIDATTELRILYTCQNALVKRIIKKELPNQLESASHSDASECESESEEQLLEEILQSSPTPSNEPRLAAAMESQALLFTKEIELDEQKDKIRKTLETFKLHFPKLYKQCLHERLLKRATTSPATSTNIYDDTNLESITTHFSELVAKLNITNTDVKTYLSTLFIFEHIIEGNLGNDISSLENLDLFMSSKRLLTLFTNKKLPWMLHQNFKTLDNTLLRKLRDIYGNFSQLKERLLLQATSGLDTSSETKMSFILKIERSFAELAKENEKAKGLNFKPKTYNFQKRVKAAAARAAESVDVRIDVKEEEEEEEEEDEDEHKTPEQLQHLTKFGKGTYEEVQGQEIGTRAPQLESLEYVIQSAFPLDSLKETKQNLDLLLTAPRELFIEKITNWLKTPAGQIEFRKFLLSLNNTSQILQLLKAIYCSNPTNVNQNTQFFLEYTNSEGELDTSVIRTATHDPNSTLVIFKLTKDNLSITRDTIQY